MKRFAITCAALVTITIIGTSDAQAGKYYFGFGHSSHAHSSHLYPSTYHTTLHPSHTLRWHDETHYDYVPGRWVLGPAGLTYIPPKRVLHIDGHYDAVPTYSFGHHHHGH